MSVHEFWYCCCTTYIELSIAFRCMYSSFLLRCLSRLRFDSRLCLPHYNPLGSLCDVLVRPLPNRWCTNAHTLHIIIDKHVVINFTMFHSVWLSLSLAKRQISCACVCVYSVPNSVAIFHLCRECSVVTTKTKCIPQKANKPHSLSSVFVTFNRGKLWKVNRNRKTKKKEKNHNEIPICERKRKKLNRMSDSEEHRFDSVLLALAEQHKNGVPEVNLKKLCQKNTAQFIYRIHEFQLLGTLAGFLARKTDFFVGGKDGEWQTVRKTCEWIYF